MSFAEFLKALYWDLYFSIFLLMAFFAVEKSDICNFANDNTLYSHGSNLPLILNNLEHDMRNLIFISSKLTHLRQTPESLSL